MTKCINLISFHSSTFSILSKSMATTPNPVSSSVISQPATAFSNSTSMYNQPPMGLSPANSYPISSLPYPKAPGVMPNAWPHPPSLSTPPVVPPVSSGLMSTGLTRPLPVSTSTHPGSYSSPMFTAPLPPSALPPTQAPLPFSAESLLSNKSEFIDMRFYYHLL